VTNDGEVRDTSHMMKKSEENTQTEEGGHHKRQRAYTSYSKIVPLSAAQAILP
jgi:hypothetical protein